MFSPIATMELCELFLDAPIIHHSTYLVINNHLEDTLKDWATQETLDTFDQQSDKETWPDKPNLARSFTNILYGYVGNEFGCLDIHWQSWLLNKQRKSNTICVSFVSMNFERLENYPDSWRKFGVNMIVDNLVV